MPVRIRNMSPSGALIEASVIPELGTKVVLKRGSLQVVGRIIRKVERRAGIAFEAIVYVADWMSRQPSAPQQQIDRLVSHFQTDGQFSTCSSDETRYTFRAGSIEAELMTLRSDLAELEAKLIDDPILIANHPEIQALDISLQRIDRMITGVRSVFAG